MANLIIQSTFKNQFKGEDCLIDIVSRDKRTSNMVLIECKVNLDNRIKRINSRRDKFKNKLRLMDELEKELTKYVNKEQRYVKVNKILASIKVPSRTLPHHYQNYHYINLYDYFRLNKNIQHH